MNTLNGVLWENTALLNNSLEFHKVMMLLFAIAEDPLPFPLVLRLGKAHQDEAA